MPRLSRQDLLDGITGLARIVSEQLPEGPDRDDALNRLRDVWRQTHAGHAPHNALLAIAARYGGTPTGDHAHRLLDRLGA